jgi:uncharacterized hydrophobic protein (TIGR00271 family)
MKPIERVKDIIEDFKISHEMEDYREIIAGIDDGVVFRGTNLWILIFAILVASLGLNLNSTAVIIGAMLISPLMGPIIGIGLALGINDLQLLRKAAYNYFFSAGVALATSTIYFAVSPLSDAHSEILARTSPNAYDVLIAFFGGLAGIIAVSSQKKGNVIPGVAIATALMPPLCTAGYGLATWQLNFFFGAFYLFLINTVFIGVATLLTVRLAGFPYKEIPDSKEAKRTKYFIWALIIFTLLPSIYFGYVIVKQTRFTTNANKFIDNEAVFENDYLLNRRIDAASKTIELTFGGAQIDSSAISTLTGKLEKYDLKNANVVVKQGFAYLSERIDKKEDPQMKNLTIAFKGKEEEVRRLKAAIDSMTATDSLNRQLFKELKALYPLVRSAAVQPIIINSDSAYNKQTIAIVATAVALSKAESDKLLQWLQVRLNTTNIHLITEVYERTDRTTKIKSK